MSCLSPFNIKFMGKYYDCPCGHCINCLSTKTAQLTFLCQREQLMRYQKNQSCSFVTFTYDDFNLPLNEYGNATLKKSDYQKFMKNLRRQLDYYNVNIKFKYLSAGEYGSTSKLPRPHYHIIFFGLSPELITPLARKCWKKGLIEVGPLTNGGIRYVSKYISKNMNNKLEKEIMETQKIELPFLNHSINMGKEWIIQNMETIAKNNFQFQIENKKYLYPKKICEFVSNHTLKDYRPYFYRFIKNQYPDYKTDLEIKDLQYENSIIKAKQLIVALQSKGLPINSETKKYKYIHPKTHVYLPKTNIENINKMIVSIYN